MKTKAAILYKLHSPLVIREVEIPPLSQGQVLVKVLASGLCRSQLNEIKGFKGPDRYLPHMMGHEGAGVVVATGKGVRKVKKNDYVVLSWIKGSGLDAAGTQYKAGNQIINSGAIATFCEHAVIAENRLTKIPKTIPPDKAALLGCAVATGAGIVLNTLNVSKGSTIAIFGAGGIGASAILAARLKGCSKIIAIDAQKEKISFAKKLGATHALIFRKDIDASVKAIVPGGVDYALEASGTKEGMEACFKAIRDKGTAVIAGNLRHDQEISINPFDLIKGKRIIGTWGGETVPDRDFPLFVRAYRAGKFPLGRLITHRFKFAQINKALATLEQGRAGRIIIRFS
ncbi:MAG TPA: zinc-binding dehydrogenase [Candidatus Omnitrophota bacterium]|nr:zinc-binding dehydrogenase [Candidatus Omnitrophota bacterium]HPD85569.1 zinc-binding dehydrogenase [Candidatus Omnitrophota bacterium]HRZ04391.1 zinc-binding dehydrogenase [Candidatus Omnitrophota bacterium]